MPTLANMSRVALRALRGEGPAQRLRHGKSQPPLLFFIVENKNIASRWLRGKDDRGNKKEVEARVKVTPRTPIGRLMGFKTGLCTFIRRWKCCNRSVVQCQLSLLGSPHNIAFLDVGSSYLNCQIPLVQRGLLPKSSSFLRSVLLHLGITRFLLRIM